VQFFSLHVIRPSEPDMHSLVVVCMEYPYSKATRRKVENVGPHFVYKKMSPSVPDRSGTHRPDGGKSSAAIGRIRRTLFNKLALKKVGNESRYQRDCEAPPALKLLLPL
jgi:hypothetical protein